MQSQFYRKGGDSTYLTRAAKVCLVQVKGKQNKAEEVNKNIS